MSKARDLASGAPAPAGVTTTELGYVDGVTSAIQTQLDAKVAKSVFTAKGSIATATAASTPAELAVGSNGQTLVADSSQTTGLGWAGNVAAGKNALINGNFDIWQRGTSGFTTNNIYTADRWFVYSQANYSLSQETSVIPNGSTYAAKITITSANGYCNLANTLEQIEVERLAGQTVTFSVNLRANSTYNGSTAVQINYSTTGNSQLATWTNLIGTTVTPLTSAYTRVSVTATIPTNAKGLQFYIGQNSVLANGSIYYIAQAQAEVGSTATPFSRAGGTIQGELAACQRYYYKAQSSTSYGWYGEGIGYNTTTAAIATNLPVTMRVAPTSVDYSTLALYDGTNGFTVTACTIDTNQVAYNKGSANISAASGIVQYRPYYIRGNGSATAYIAYNAEL